MAKIAADHRHPARRREHVQVDVPANSRILRVRDRDTVPKTAHRRFEQDAPFLHPCWWSSTSTLIADPEDTLAQIPAFLDLEGDIPPDGIDTRRSTSHGRQWATLPRAAGGVRAGPSRPRTPAGA